MTDLLKKLEDAASSISKDDVSNALCNAYDVRSALSKRILNRPKEDDGTDCTIGDCLDDIILFLETLEETFPE
jgi:hypothetical protein